MAQSLPVNASDYYEFLPPPEHRAGDIWSDLPTFGMLGLEHVTGVVITPACDLQNCKTETVTYLPIVSVREAFALKGFLPEVVRAINGQVEVLGVDGLDDNGAPFTPVNASLIEGLVVQVEKKARGGKFNSKEKAAAERVMAGASILRKTHVPSVVPASSQELKTLFGSSALNKLVERLVTNSYKADLHFLPSDLEPSQWSAIPEASVVLFRHVFSAPIEVFDCAQDTSRAEWSNEIQRISSYAPGVTAFGSCRPMKRQTLRPRFAADLLTRYIAMHVRLGAPDFTEQSIRAHVADIFGASE